MTKTGVDWPVWKAEDRDNQSPEVISDTESEFRKKTKVLVEAKLMTGEGPLEIRKPDAPFNLNIMNFSSMTKQWHIQQ